MKHLPLQCDQVEYSSVSISRGKRTLFQAIENTKNLVWQASNSSQIRYNLKIHKPMVNPLINKSHGTLKYANSVY